MSGVLHVCTANQCRSAIAERLMRASLPPEVPVTSAGTRARPGEPIWPEAAVELERRGVSALGFAAYPVDAPLVAGADLVLTATRRHRDLVVSTFPAALQHTFTWLELAWLVDALPPGGVPGASAAERVAALATAANGVRGHLAAPPGDRLDVRDPVGGPPGAVAAAAQQIEDALRRIVRVLVPASVP